VSPEEKNQYTHRSMVEKVIRDIKDKAKDFLKKIA
jgi:hypothetical protein